LVRSFQAITLFLIRTYTVLKSLDGLVLDRESICVILSAIGVVAILRLEHKDPILETRVLGPERPAKLTAFLHLRARRHGASAAEHERDCDELRSENATNHSFRLLSGTIVRKTSASEHP
jgi:hypothetical protein